MYGIYDLSDIMLSISHSHRFRLFNIFSREATGTTREGNPACTAFF